ncbi:unnamed protein product, partial [Closterium sp. NIES-53]
MASLRVLVFDHEGRPIQFDTWLQDLQLYLLSESRDSVSLFNHTSGVAAAPPATADSATCSKWLTRDAAARLAIRNHLLLAECAHFGQHRHYSPMAPLPRSPLPATPSWHALPPPYLWSSRVSASPPALACPALPSLCRGAATCRSSLLVSLDECSPADSPHGRLRERFRAHLAVLRLHSYRGGEFSSDLLRDFCRGEGILQSFMLPASPQQNWIAERRIGLIMEVARTSMIHAAAPHSLWPFVVWYTAHQLNLWPYVSLPETSPKLRWTGEVGDASVFQVWGSRAFVCDMSRDKLFTHAIPCFFLGFTPDVPGLQFYHPTLRRVIPSEDVTFDESVPFYRHFPYRSAHSPPPPFSLLQCTRLWSVAGGAGVSADRDTGAGAVEVTAGAGGTGGAATAGLGGARTRDPSEPGGTGARGTGAGGAGARGARGTGEGGNGAGGAGAGDTGTLDPGAGGAGVGGAVSGGTGAGVGGAVSG